MAEGGKEGKVVWNGGWEGVTIGSSAATVDWSKVKSFNAPLSKTNGFSHRFMVPLSDYFKERLFFSQPNFTAFFSLLKCIRAIQICSNSTVVYYRIHQDCYLYDIVFIVQLCHVFPGVLGLIIIIIIHVAQLGLFACTVHVPEDKIRPVVPGLE